MTTNKNVFDQSAAYVARSIRTIIERFGPRAPGSPGERQAQQYLLQEMAPFVDETHLEDFRLSPRAFMSLPRVAGTLLLLASAVWWIDPRASLPFSLAAFMTIVLELILYKPFLDPFFPKATSCNIMGIVRPAGERRRRIIVSGHADAAYEWRFNLKSRTALLLVVGSAILTVAIKLPMDIAALVAGANWQEGYGTFWGALGLVHVLTVPVGIAGWRFTNFDVVSPGANDNLTGALAAIAVAKILHDAGERLEHTELVVQVTGAEEAGLRGAKAYAAAHRRDLHEVDTVFLGLETFRDIDFMAVVSRDMNGLVQTDPRVCALLQDAAAGLGYRLPTETAYIGSTDAAAFSQAGVPAATLAGMNPAPPRYYHTRLDDWNNVDAACISRALEITLAAIRAFDRFGLPDRR